MLSLHVLPASETKHAMSSTAATDKSKKTQDDIAIVIDAVRPIRFSGGVKHMNDGYKFDTARRKTVHVDSTCGQRVIHLDTYSGRYIPPS